MPDEEKKVIRRVVEELWNRRNPDLADTLFSSTYMNHDPNSPDFGRGPQSYKRYYNLYTMAFPDLRMMIDSIVSEGDLVALRWTATGTHRGKFADIEPTGCPIAITGATISRVMSGKVHETWTQWDALGLMRQIGAVRTGTRAAG